MYLVWKLKRGSRSALRRIYEKYRSDLLRIAAGLLVETADAEDVVHDVFASFVESCRHFQLTGSLRGYPVICGANRTGNRNRSRARQAAIEGKGTWSMNDLLVFDYEAPEKLGAFFALPTRAESPHGKRRLVLGTEAVTIALQNACATGEPRNEEWT